MGAEEVMGVARICFERDHRYVGDIYCPECDEPSGEPIEQEGD